MLELTLGYFDRPIIYAVVITLLCIPLMRICFRKTRPLPAVLLAITLALLWYMPLERISARIVFHAYQASMAEHREVVSTEYYMNKQGGTSIHVVYADDPDNVYQYWVESMFDGITEDERHFSIAPADK